MNPIFSADLSLNRRAFLSRAATGIGALALGSLLLGVWDRGRLLHW